MGEAGLMAAIVDSAGAILAANAAFAARTVGADGEAQAGRGQRTSSTISPRRAAASSTSRPRARPAPPLADRPGPGRRRAGRALRLPACSTTCRARAATTRPRTSTPCSTACRSASRSPTRTAASCSSTRCSARRSASTPTSGRPGPATSSSTRTRRRSPTRSAASAAAGRCRATSRFGSRPTRRSRWR